MRPSPVQLALRVRLLPVALLLMLAPPMLALAL